MRNWNWLPARRVLLLVLCGVLWHGVALGSEEWRDVFDRTCAKTTNAMELSVLELKQLLERCDVLQKTIEGQEESLRKVYLKRLQLCRNLYLYVLDYKNAQAEEAKADQGKAGQGK